MKIFFALLLGFGLYFSAPAAQAGSNVVISVNSNSYPYPGYRPYYNDHIVVRDWGPRRYHRHHPRFCDHDVYVPRYYKPRRVVIRSPIYSYY